jgi:hypothetical protein
MRAVCHRGSTGDGNIVLKSEQYSSALRALFQDKKERQAIPLNRIPLRSIFF